MASINRRPSMIAQYYDSVVTDPSQQGPHNSSVVDGDKTTTSAPVVVSVNLADILPKEERNTHADFVEEPLEVSSRAVDSHLALSSPPPPVDAFQQRQAPPQQQADDSLTRQAQQQQHNVHWRGEVLKVGIQHNNNANNNPSFSMPTAKSHPREIVINDDGNLYVCLPSDTSHLSPRTRLHVQQQQLSSASLGGGVTRTIGLLAIDEVIVYEPASSSSSSSSPNHAAYTLPSNFLEAVGMAKRIADEDKESSSSRCVTAQYLLDLVAEYFPDDWLCKIVVSSVDDDNAQDVGSPTTTPPLPLWLLFPTANDGEHCIETIFNDVRTIIASFEGAVADVGEAMAITAAQLSDAFVKRIKHRQLRPVAVKVSQRVGEGEVEEAIANVQQYMANRNRTTNAISGGGRSSSLAAAAAAAPGARGGQTFGRTGSIPRGTTDPSYALGAANTTTTAVPDFGSGSPESGRTPPPPSRPPPPSSLGIRARDGHDGDAGVDKSGWPVSPTAGRGRAAPPAAADNDAHSFPRVGASAEGNANFPTNSVAGDNYASNKYSSKPLPPLPNANEDFANEGVNHYKLTQQQQPSLGGGGVGGRVGHTHNFNNSNPTDTNHNPASDLLLQRQLQTLQQELAVLRHEQGRAQQEQARREKQWETHVMAIEERHQRNLLHLQQQQQQQHNNGNPPALSASTSFSTAAADANIKSRDAYESHIINNPIAAVAPPVPNPIQDDQYLKQLAASTSTPHMAVVSSLLQASQKRLLECEQETEQLREAVAAEQRRNQSLQDEVESLQTGVLERQRQEYQALQQSKEEELAKVREAFQKYEAQVHQHVADMKKKHEGVVDVLKQRLESSQRRVQHLRYHLQRLEGSVDGTVGGGAWDDGGGLLFGGDDGGSGEDAGEGIDADGNLIRVPKTPLSKYRMQILGGGGGVGDHQNPMAMMDDADDGQHQQRQPPRANNKQRVDLSNTTADEITKSFIDAIRNTPSKATSSILKLPSSQNHHHDDDTDSHTSLAQKYVGASNINNNANKRNGGGGGAAAPHQTASLEDTAVTSLLTKLERFIDLKASDVAENLRRKDDAIRFDRLQAIAIEEKRKADVERSVAAHRRQKEEAHRRWLAEEAEHEAERQQMLKAMREQCAEDETVEEIDEDDVEYEARYNRPRTSFTIVKRRPKPLARKLRQSPWDEDEPPEYYRADSQTDDRDLRTGDDGGGRGGGYGGRPPLTGGRGGSGGRKGYGGFASESDYDAEGGDDKPSRTAARATAFHETLQNYSKQQQDKERRQHQQLGGAPATAATTIPRSRSNSRTTTPARRAPPSSSSYHQAALERAQSIYERAQQQPLIHHQQQHQQHNNNATRPLSPSATRRLRAASSNGNHNGHDPRAAAIARRYQADADDDDGGTTTDGGGDSLANRAASIEAGYNELIRGGDGGRYGAKGRTDNNGNNKSSVYGPPSMAIPPVNEASPKRAPLIEGDGKTTHQRGGLAADHSSTATRSLDFSAAQQRRLQNISSVPRHVLSDVLNDRKASLAAVAVGGTTTSSRATPNQRNSTPIRVPAKFPATTTAATNSSVSANTPAHHQQLHLQHGAAHALAINRIKTNAAIMRGSTNRDRSIL